MRITFPAPLKVSATGRLSFEAMLSIVILLFGMAIYSNDSLLFLGGASVLMVFIRFFLDKNSPPVLLFSACMAWFFFQGQLVDALLKNQDIVRLDYFSSTRSTVILLGMVASLAFFGGIYLISRNVRPQTFEQTQMFFMKVHIGRLLRVYLIVYTGVFLTSNLIWLIPGLSQPFFILVQFRWSIFFLLFIACFAQKRMKGALLLIILLDILLGFFSFFSHFKEPFYFSFLAYWIFYFRQSLPTKLIVFAILILVYFLGTYWTAIKEDYRAFLNKGSGAQVVRVTRSEAYSKLIELMLGVKQKDLDKGADDLLTRLSWIGALDAVYNHVPRKIPHEGGALWLEATTRPFLPRLLFPDKKVLSDSKELNHYSGLRVDEKNTSISLSMIAGSYVDFGVWGMHVVLFVFGLFCGWVYKKVIGWGGGYPMVGFALAMPMIYLFQIAEQSINRIVSFVVLYLLVVWFIQKFLLKPFLKFIFVK